MAIRPRGTSFQVSLTVNGTRIRKDFPTYRDAEVFEATTKAALLTGKPVQGLSGSSDPTLEEFLEVVYEARWRGKKSGERLYRNGQIVVALLGLSRKVSSLSRADMDKVKVTFRDQGCTVATQNRKLAALSVICAEARERGLLDKLFKSGMGREPKGRVRVMSRGEQQEALRLCDEHDLAYLKDYIIVSLDTGFRQGEVFRIQKRDVGGDTLWTYDTKSGKNRGVPLTARSRSVLERRAKSLESPSGNLFPLDRYAVLNMWHELRDLMRLHHDMQFIPHCMRHTFVTEMLEAGVDIRTVMELAGHSRIETTQRYAHTSPDRMAAAILKRQALCAPEAGHAVQ